MGRITEISARLIGVPAEMVAEFESKGTAKAAKANLDIFLRWALTAEEGKAIPPPIVLILNQTKLSPHDDRPRKSDWKDAPEARLEGDRTVVLDAPRSKHAREVLRRFLANEKPKSLAFRKKAGAGGRIALAIGIAVVVAAGVGAAVLAALGRLDLVLGGGL